MLAMSPSLSATTSWKQLPITETWVCYREGPKRRKKKKEKRDFFPYDAMSYSAKDKVRVVKLTRCAAEKKLDSYTEIYK